MLLSVGPGRPRKPKSPAASSPSSSSYNRHARRGRRFDRPFLPPASRPSWFDEQFQRGFGNQAGPLLARSKRDVANSLCGMISDCRRRSESTTSPPVDVSSVPVTCDDRPLRLRSPFVTFSLTHFQSSCRNSEIELEILFQDGQGPVIGLYLQRNGRGIDPRGDFIK